MPNFMCGRYTHLFTWAELHRLMRLGELTAEESALLLPRYNVAPQQLAPVIISSGSGRQLVGLRWGLIPFWSKDPSIGNRTINARAETLDTSPAFRDAFKKHRCLIPASGFYEWQPIPGAKRKQPWYITPSNGDILFFAGVWDEWTPAGADPIRTFSIITTGPNDVMRPIHNRMPVILTPDQADPWLDTSRSPAEVMSLLAPCDPSVLHAITVSPKVNSVAFDDPACIRPEAPLGEPPSLFGAF